MRNNFSYFSLFLGLDWEDVYNKKLKPPFVPKIVSDGDTSNFQDYSDDELEINPVTEREARVFDKFWKIFKKLN